MTKIAFIGLGEAGSALITGWGPERAREIIAYDIKQQHSQTEAEIQARAGILGVRLAKDAAEAVASADLVFCTVTADQAVAASQASAKYLPAGCFWCDLNSCAPSSKQQAADIIEAEGGKYVDVAVMAPVHPNLNLAPLLISGPHAAEIAPILEGLPMVPRIIDGAVGRASSIKMLRSVMVKGLEALTAECTLAAVAAGVEDEVLGSLNKSHPGSDWDQQAAYNFERSIVHGARRAAEMEEVVKTLADLGLPSGMAQATVDWQRRIAGAGVAAPESVEVKARVIAETLLPVIKNS